MEAVKVRKLKPGRKPNFSIEEVHSIRKMYNDNLKLTIQYLAKKYGVSKQTMYSLLTARGAYRYY